MITIQKSPTADTRTCDWSKVTKAELAKASQMHIRDVQLGLAWLANLLRDAGYEHDLDKLTDIDAFHADFATGFRQTTWWDRHRKGSRHHLDKADGVPEDVDLLDVIEHVVDCVMAGLARSGSVYDLKLPDDVLQRAFHNTVKIAKGIVRVEDTDRSKEGD